MFECFVVSCPVGLAIGDVPLLPQVAHQSAECGNQGICNRTTGVCDCFPPYTGTACDKCTIVNYIVISNLYILQYIVTCPTAVTGKECSGHGVCWNMHDIALDVGMNYGSTAQARTTTAWDYNTMYACLCNSSWPVGYNAHEYQLAEYFRADCSYSKYFYYCYIKYITMFLIHYSYYYYRKMS